MALRWGSCLLLDDVVFATQPRVALKLWKYFCLSLWDARITGMQHCVWLIFKLFTFTPNQVPFPAVHGNPICSDSPLRTLDSLWLWLFLLLSSHLDYREAHNVTPAIVTRLRLSESLCSLECLFLMGGPQPISIAHHIAPGDRIGSPLHSIYKSEGALIEGDAGMDRGTNGKGFGVLGN